MIEQLPAIEARFGKGSFEYVALLVQLGDAHMVQGRLSNPQAQASYAAGLAILQAQEGERAETAWLYDKLANVKNSSGDSFGAQADLEKAVSFWKDHAPANAIAPVSGEDYVARREEDLQRLRKLNEFKNRKPPSLTDDAARLSPSPNEESDI